MFLTYSTPHSPPTHTHAGEAMDSTKASVGQNVEAAQNRAGEMADSAKHQAQVSYLWDGERDDAMPICAFS